VVQSRSPGTSVVSISQLRDQQEAMLLMKTCTRVRTSAAIWRLELSDSLPNGARLRLISGEL
jgi:hypothetical protein